ncbi:redoxin domain-containing protein [Roseibacillus ishigakijimensis]|uniref:Redoxin domain-containing protein n=1 Tax=Roseibacillus ishigakijimensis TaxID=454146 RepID=A0A934RMV5_9BACT|nr:redoxin domain-containing protein [Roseibacillus ishigakijimensis]MBK1832572.1 redoxin domain-containing protein [Roseibacillus ishigakijimensis]
MKKPLTSLLLASGLLLATSSAYTPEPITQGTTAPAFELPGVDGKTYTLDDIRGEKATAIIFTTNHCPDAIASVGRMKALVDQFSAQGVGFVAINSNSPEGLHLEELGWTVYDDSFEDMKLIAADEEFNLPYLYDGETQETAKAYGAVATPHVFIFDADLQLKYNGRLDDGRRSLGPAEKNEARDALTAILAGKEPAITKTRPIGCTTKWKEKAGHVAGQNEKWNNLPVTLETADADTIAKLRSNGNGTDFRLFNVWSTTCGPCVMEFPDLVEIYRQYSWQDFEFITISLDPAEDLKKAEDFLARKECGLSPRAKAAAAKEGRSTNNYLFTGDTEELVKALDPEWNGAMPHTLLVDGEGKVLFRHTGVVEPLALRKAIVAQVWSQGE